MDRVELPARGPDAEEAFLQALEDFVDTSPEVVEALIGLVGEALDAARPKLAARLVGLVPDDVDADGPEIERARRAAALLLHRHDDPDVVYTEELARAWEGFRSRRMRLKHRARRSLRGKPEEKPRRRGRRKR